MDDTNDIREVAKAAAEASKFGTKALEVSEKLTSFLVKVFQAPAGEAVGIMSDKLQYLRWERQVRLADKVQSIIELKGLKKTGPVPPKFALPIIEAASVEEEDNLQDLWANLLVNQMDPAHSIDMRFSFIDIVKKLNSIDVHILQTFYDSFRGQFGNDSSKLGDFIVKKNEFTSKLSISDESYYLSIHNLFSTQCLAPAVIKGGMKFGDYHATSYMGAEEVILTMFGLRIVESAMT